MADNLGRGTIVHQKDGVSSVDGVIPMQPVPGSCEVKPEWQDLINAPPAYQMHYLYGEDCNTVGSKVPDQNSSSSNKTPDAEMSLGSRVTSCTKSSEKEDTKTNDMFHNPRPDTVAAVKANTSTGDIKVKNNKIKWRKLE